MIKIIKAYSFIFVSVYTSMASAALSDSKLETEFNKITRIICSVDNYYGLGRTDVEVLFYLDLKNNKWMQSFITYDYGEFSIFKNDLAGSIEDTYDLAQRAPSDLKKGRGSYSLFSDSSGLMYTLDRRSGRLENNINKGKNCKLLQFESYKKWFNVNREAYLESYKDLKF